MRDSAFIKFRHFTFLTDDEIVGCCFSTRDIEITCEYIEIEWLSMSGLSVDNCKATVFLPQDRYGDHIQSVHFTVTASDMPATSSAVVYLRMAGRVVSQAITIPFVRASGQSPLVVR